MKCCIVAVGNEVVSGDIVNTNAATLANLLKPYGIRTVMHIAVEDTKKDIKKAVKRALKCADLVFTTGGLGPTYDDITKKSVAEALDRELVRDEYSVTVLKSYFERMGREMIPSNLSQCDFPKGAQIIQNPNGTAPACITETKEGTVVMLPGPPAEVQAIMQTEEMLTFLDGLKEEEIVETTLRFIGIGESNLAELLREEMKAEDNLILAPYAKTGEVHLKITAKGKTKEEAEELTENLIQIIDQKAGQYIYAEGNHPLEEVLVHTLIENGHTLVTAESCTGGMIGQTVTAVPGSSKPYLGGVVTYSNELKMALCGVLEETLAKHGAVSPETACEMAEGIRNRLQADIAVSVTGIAGPGGGTEEKPVGLVYIGVSTSKATEAYRFQLMGNRDKIRQLSVKNALHLALKASKNLIVSAQEE